MTKTDHFEREARRLLTQMVEVRSAFADIGQRQKSISELSDSVAARNTALELQNERQYAQSQLDRINADLRILALVRDDQARKSFADAQQTARDKQALEAIAQKDQDARAAIAQQEHNARAAIAQKEQDARAAIAKEDREKVAAAAKEDATRDKQLRDAIEKKEQDLLAAIAQKEQDARAAIAQQEREKVDAGARGDTPKDRSAENNPVADAVSAAAIATTKAADVWLEIYQLAKHLAERQALELAQQQERESLEKQQAKEARDLERAMEKDGKDKNEIAEGLAQQAKDHERQRNEQEWGFESKQQALAAEQVKLEQDRNQRADKQGLSVGSNSQQLADEQAKQAQQEKEKEKQPTLDNVRDRNPVADALSAAAIAAVKAVDVWIEVAQLAKHLVEREAQKAVQEQQREQLEKAIAQQAHDVEKSMTARGKTKGEIDEALKRQAEIHEQQRLKQEEAFERQRQELAEKQVAKERERNERADRDGISL